MRVIVPEKNIGGNQERRGWTEQEKTGMHVREYYYKPFHMNFPAFPTGAKNDENYSVHNY